MQKRLSIPIPSGGLVVDKPAEFIDLRAISSCQNIQIDRNIVEKRIGGTVLGAALGERILGQTEMEHKGVTYFVRVGPTRAQILNKTTLAWSSITNVALTALETDEVSFAFPLLSNVKYIVYTNGVDNIRKFVGTGVDANLEGSPPKCKYVLDFKGYLILAHVIDGDTFGSRVQWSDTGAPETWTGGNAGSANLLEDSNDITGLARFGDYIAVHKENSIHVGQLVTTSDVFRFTRRETSGCIANGSIQNLPDGTQIYLSRDGIRLFNGVTSILIPSTIIDELRDSINPTYVKRSTSVLVKDLDEYWVGIPIGNQTEPETVYKYNYKTGQVYKDARSGLMSMALYKRVSSDTWDEASGTWDSDSDRWDTITELALHRQVVCGHRDGYSILRSSTNNDNATAIDSIWDTKDFTIADIDTERDIGNLIRWKGLDIWALGNSVTVYYSTDSGNTWTQIDEIDLSSDYPGDDSPDILYFDVLSSKIRFRFRNNTAGETWSLKQYVIWYSVREARK